MGSPASRRFAATLLSLCAALTAGSAVAADPENGKVDRATPVATWNGDAFGPMGPAFSEGTGGNCRAPVCDTYTLEVADGPADLAFTLKTTNYGNLEFEIEPPDGAPVYETTDTNEPIRRTVIKQAANGSYEVHVWAWEIDAPEPMVYEGRAELTVAPVATPAPSAEPSASPSPQPSPSPSPSPNASPPPAAPAAVTMSIRSGKASARRLARAKKVAVSVSTSAPLSNVKLSLRKGKRTVGAVTVASLSGTRKLTVRLRRKLARGRYGLFASGRDAQGRAVTATGTLRVSR